jgi:amino acid transporter
VITLAAQLGFEVHGPGVVAVYLTVAVIILDALTRGVRFAAVVILAIEMCSLIFIIGLMLLVGSTGKVAVAQPTPSPQGLLFVVLTAIFALAGFESATFFAPEARRPLITVTRAVQLTPVICGALLIFAGWAAWSGRADLIVNAYLHGSAAGVSPVMVVVLNAGLTCSWLASSMSSSNAASRLIYSMSIEGVLPRAFTKVHRRLRTPYVALAAIVASVLSAAVMFVALGGIPAEVKMAVRIALVTAYLP